MNSNWVVTLPLQHSNSLSRLRLSTGIQVLADDERLWLRGSVLTKDVENLLKVLPGSRLYSQTDDERLIPAGKRVPTGCMPEGDWLEIAQWCPVTLGLSAFPAIIKDQTALQMQRSASPTDANLIITPFPNWEAFAIRASQVRLDGLAFAVNNDGYALIRGRTPPPIAGRWFVEKDGIAVDAGWTWFPAVEHIIIRNVLALSDSEVGIVYGTGHWERAREEDFVRATRSAIRLTAKALADRHSD